MRTCPSWPELPRKRGLSCCSHQRRYRHGCKCCSRCAHVQAWVCSPCVRTCTCAHIATHVHTDVCHALKLACCWGAHPPRHWSCAVSNKASLVQLFTKEFTGCHTRVQCVLVQLVFFCCGCASDPLPFGSVCLCVAVIVEQGLASVLLVLRLYSSKEGQGEGRQNTGCVPCVL